MCKPKSYRFRGIDSRNVRFFCSKPVVKLLEAAFFLSVTSTSAQVLLLMFAAQNGDDK